MSSIDPTNSLPALRLAQAYSVPRPSVRPIPMPDVEYRSQAVATSRAKLAGVVAGTVAGRVDFSGATPQADTAAIPMYRHPADKNAAATSIHAGRMIDVVG